MTDCALLLQSYWNGRPLYNAMPAANFFIAIIIEMDSRPLRDSMHAKRLYSNLIGMVGLHIYILSLINIHEVVTWLIKIA